MGVIPQTAPPASDLFDPAWWLQTGGSIAKSAAMILGIVIAMMVIIELLKALGWVERAGRAMQAYLAPLGLSGRSGFPLAAGLLFGLAYGAGVIVQAARENQLPGRERFMLCFFLSICHAVVEDTLLFVPLGVNPLILLGIRFSAAVALTALLALSLRRRGVLAPLGGPGAGGSPPGPAD